MKTQIFDNTGSFLHQVRAESPKRLNLDALHINLHATFARVAVLANAWPLAAFCSDPVTWAVLVALPT